MALTVADRVRETTTTEGTGAIALGGAVAGCSTFASRLAINDITFYAIVLGTQWEVGLGTLSAATTLQRTTVFASSNGDALVSFASGAKDVFVDFPAYLADRLADFAVSEASVAAAATVDLGAANARKVAISGTAAITSFGARTHREKLLRFTGSSTLTHDATALILPGAANIVTAVGDTALATSDGSGNWRVRHYQRADGSALASGVAIDDFRSLAIQVAKLKGSVANLQGGVVDDFKDQSGIDTAASTGFGYDATNSLVILGSTGGSESSESLPAMTSDSTPSGYTTSATSSYSTVYSAWYAADTNDSTEWGSLNAPSSGTPQTWTRTFPALNLAGIAIKASAASGNTQYAPRNFTIQALVSGTWSTVGSPAAQTGWGVSERRVFTFSPVANCTGMRVVTTGTAGTDYLNVARFEVLQGTAAAAGDVRSIAFTAQAVPTKGSLYILVKATTGTLTPGTNFIASLSRDGGTTYTAFGLTQTGTVAGYAILEANAVSIAGQPSGSSMKWRLQTVGTAVAVAVDAVVAQWG